MRNKLLLLVFVMFAALYSIAQTNKVSFQGGVTGTGFLFSPPPDQKIKFGDIYYLGYEFESKRKLLVSVGVEYLTMGSSTNSEIITFYNASMYGNTIDFKYISIPLKLGVRLGDNWFGFGYLGASSRYLLNATNETSLFSPDFNQTGEYKKDIIQYVKRFDFAGIVDLGFGKRFSNHELFLSCSFTVSRTSIASTSIDAMTIIPPYDKVNGLFGRSEPLNYGGILKVGYSLRF